MAGSVLRRLRRDRLRRWHRDRHGADSDVQTLTDSGRYEFWAVAAANANNEAATSTCGSETVIVPLTTPRSPSRPRSRGPPTTRNAADGAHITSGESVYDTATVTGAASPTQTVTYYVAGPFLGAFAATDCATGTAIGTGVKSNAQTLTAAGRYEFWAVAAANANNNAATSTCGSETVVITQNIGAKTMGFWRNKNGQGIITSFCKGKDGNCWYG